MQKIEQIKQGEFSFVIIIFELWELLKMVINEFDQATGNLIYISSLKLK
jgi:hypothetical protein